MKKYESLEELFTDAKTVVERDVSRVVLNHRFFASCIVHLTIRPAFVGTMCTDGTRILYDPRFVMYCEENEPDGSIVGTLVHEVMHNVLLHPFRFSKARHEHEQANRAMDYEINNMIADYNSERDEKSRIVLPSMGLIDPQYANMAWEEIYPLLPANKKSKGGKGKGGKGSGGGSGTPGDGTPGDGDGTPDDALTPMTREEFEKALANGEIGVVREASSGESEQAGKKAGTAAQDGKGSPGSQKTKTAADWAGIVAAAQADCMVAGDRAGGLTKHLDKLFKPKIDCAAILRRFASELAHNDYDMRKSDRRYIQQGLYFPTLHNESFGEVVFAIDTSGSVYGEEFNHFMGVVDHVLRTLRPRKTTVIQCDAAIQEIRDYRPGQTINQHTEMKGGGGTSFLPVFEHIAKKAEKPRVLIYITDGYGTFPQVKPPFPVVWINSVKARSQYPDWAEVIDLHPAQ